MLNKVNRVWTIIIYIYIGIIFFLNKDLEWSFSVPIMVNLIIFVYISLMLFICIVRDANTKILVHLEVNLRKINTNTIVLPGFMMGIFCLSIKNMYTIMLGAILMTFTMFVLSMLSGKCSLVEKGIMYRGQLIRWVNIDSYSVNNEEQLLVISLKNNKKLINLKYHLYERENMINLCNRYLKT